MKRLIITNEVSLILSLLDNDEDRMTLIRALELYGQTNEVYSEHMTVKVEKAFNYLTDPIRATNNYADCMD